MEDEKPTLINIAKEISTKGYWGRARERSRSAKTIWDLVFLPAGFGAIGLIWFMFFKSFLWLHVLVYPTDLARLKTLMGGSMTLGQALIGLVPLFSAIPLGLMAGNVLMWLVPPARRASEKKAKGVKWASFRDSQMALAKIALVLVPVGIVCGVIGALILGK
jgi:hypothetical protein